MKKLLVVLFFTCCEFGWCQDSTSIRKLTPLQEMQKIIVDQYKKQLAEYERKKEHIELMNSFFKNGERDIMTGEIRYHTPVPKPPEPPRFPCPDSNESEPEGMTIELRRGKYEIYKGKSLITRITTKGKTGEEVMQEILDAQDK